MDASKSYPQTVNLDTAKAKTAEIQSEQSKGQGGVTKPTDEASKARVRPSDRTIRASACTCDICAATLRKISCMHLALCLIKSVRTISL